jgi:thioredoxin 1
MVKNINLDTFETDVLNASKPVLVDVWAPWCGPCHMIAPMVESIAKDLEGQVEVVKVNADDNPGLLQRYNIMGIPTLLYFNHGQLVHRVVGVQPEPIIRAHLERIANLTPEEAASKKVRSGGGLLAQGANLLLLAVVAITIVSLVARLF